MTIVKKKQKGRDIHEDMSVVSPPDGNQNAEKLVTRSDKGINERETTFAQGSVWWRQKKKVVERPSPSSFGVQEWTKLLFSYRF